MSLSVSVIFSPGTAVCWFSAAWTAVAASWPAPQTRAGG
ncbi:hypothetical protein RKD29_007950 [Streptomyces tendae]